MELSTRMACRVRPRSPNRICKPRTERMGSWVMASSLLQMVLGVGGVREGVADQVKGDGDKA